MTVIVIKIILTSIGYFMATLFVGLLSCLNSKESEAEKRMWKGMYICGFILCFLALVVKELREFSMV